MAFSGLFGKKKPKEVEPRDRGSSAAVRPDAGRPEAPQARDLGAARRGPNTRSPPALSPRDVARATAEKIDLIESQIESEIMQSRTDFSASRSGTMPRQVAGRASGIRSNVASNVGSSTDIMLGDSQLAHSMVLADAGNPVLEEAAILYANGQDLPAVSVLSAAVFDDRTPDTWMMLLELYQSLGKRSEFETLAIDFAVRFETSAPAWSETQARPAPAPPPAARAAIVFKGALDARIVPQLEELKKLAQRNAVLHLEFDQVTSVDPQGADLILRVFAAFSKSKHQVAISGASQLADRLRDAVKVGRRESSNAVWMLLLEVYRILGRQAAFEETSIDYCVTFEVSPPSWEPASSKYVLEDQQGSAAPAVAIDLGGDTLVHPDQIALSGDLVGKSDSELARLSAFANSRQNVIVNCARLARVDFTAAGLLLNWAVGMRGQRKQIEFVNVGHLVAALFVVMGLHEVVPIERRKV